MLPTIDWKDDGIIMVDQRKLPTTETYVMCRSARDVARAIKTMVIRGAPAIGVAAAMGLALGARRIKARGTGAFAAEFNKLAELMRQTRPTAVNLFWAVARMKQVLADQIAAGKSVEEIQDRLETEACAIHNEDVESCKRIGEHGAALIPDVARVLTHCNAGGLATAGYGTALGIIRAAVAQGKHVHVFVDETRPFLQGSRLTAWELAHERIPATIIADSMAASFMRRREIDLAVVGADRIASNGDVANKIGTYGVAVLAKEHGLPLYVAAPLSTVDLQVATGDDIPIEERSAREVTHIAGVRVAPEGAEVRNPAFDVTPADLVAAIITERGVVRAPYPETLRMLAARAPAQVGSAR